MKISLVFNALFAVTGIYAGNVASDNPEITTIDADQLSRMDPDLLRRIASLAGVKSSHRLAAVNKEFNAALDTNHMTQTWLKKHGKKAIAAMANRGYSQAILMKLLQNNGLTQRNVNNAFRAAGTTGDWDKVQHLKAAIAPIVADFKDIDLDAAERMAYVGGVQAGVLFDGWNSHDVMSVLEWNRLIRTAARYSKSPKQLQTLKSILQEFESIGGNQDVAGWIPIAKEASNNPNPEVFDLIKDKDPLKETRDAHQQLSRDFLDPSQFTSYPLDLNNTTHMNAFKHARMLYLFRQPTDFFGAHAYKHNRYERAHAKDDDLLIYARSSGLSNRRLVRALLAKWHSNPIIPSRSIQRLFNAIERGDLHAIDNAWPMASAELLKNRNAKSIVAALAIGPVAGNRFAVLEHLGANPDLKLSIFTAACEAIQSGRPRILLQLLRNGLNGRKLSVNQQDDLWMTHLYGTVDRKTARNMALIDAAANTPLDIIDGMARGGNADFIVLQQGITDAINVAKQVGDFEIIQRLEDLKLATQ